MAWGIATCPHCGVDEPLVMTFAFSGAEFICLGCGGTFGFLDPVGAVETPELLARMEERKAEWQPIGEALLSGGGMKMDCATCRTGHEPHIAHATKVDLAAHEEALAKVKALRGEPA